MDERRALMAAIIANPGEDTPRLALADWLQEHGDRHDQARAEFIRLQIEATQLPFGSRERKSLDSSSSKLETKHRKRWLAPLAAISEKLAAQSLMGFDRGLLSRVYVKPGDFLKKQWQAALPHALAAVGVEELHFSRPTTRPEEFANSPAFRWVAKVDYPEANDAALAAFARSDPLAQLSELQLDEVRVTDAGLRDFAKHTHTARLKKLELTTRGPLSNTVPKFTSKGVLALLKSERVPRLTSLEVGALTGARFGLRGFAADPALRKLERLWLEMEGQAADVLASPHLGNLRALTLCEFSMTDDDVNTLLARRSFPKLEELRLYLQTQLSAASEHNLRKRFGDQLELSYDFDTDA
jgi:uncharacterized protein (TIGR02996 family)